MADNRFTIKSCEQENGRNQKNKKQKEKQYYSMLMSFSFIIDKPTYKVVSFWEAWHRGF